MKYIVVTILLVVALALTNNTNDSFFSMWLISEPIVLLMARGVTFKAIPSNNYKRDYKKIMRKI